jgi:hypothetical protein
VFFSAGVASVFSPTIFQIDTMCFL